MLDIQYIRDNPKEVKQACRDKQFSDSVIDELLAVDEKRRKLQYQVDQIRKAINENSDTV